MLTYNAIAIETATLRAKYRDAGFYINKNETIINSILGSHRVRYCVDFS